MLSEQKIKKQLETIMGAAQGPVGKAREILRLSGKVKEHAQALAGMGFLFYQKGDFQRSKRFFRSSAELLEIMSGLRMKARDCLGTKPAMSFGYSARPQAHPKWKSANKTRPWRPTEVR